MDEVAEIKAAARYCSKGRLFDEFTVGERIKHHWGRTVTESDTISFTHSTLSYNPLYFNREYAKAQGHPDIVVNPHLVFNIILGLTVEECSEGIGGPFLGVDQLRYHRPVYPGDTLTAISTVTDQRMSDKDANRGIVTWHSEGFNQDGALVVDFVRSNLAVFDLARKNREGKLG